MNTINLPTGVAASPCTLVASPYTLVIVDMQPGFSAADDARTINGTMDEIRTAMALNMPIIFVISDEEKYGALNPDLVNLVKNSGYDPDLWSIELKFYRYGERFSASSGCKQVDEACEVFGFPTNRFRFCGVNTDICVFFTAMELGKLYPQSCMEIVMRACNVMSTGISVDTAKVFAMYADDHDFTNYTLEP